MTDLPLSRFLMPVGHEALYRLREQVIASFAEMVEETWPQVSVPADTSESETWRLVQKLLVDQPGLNEQVRTKHPIIHAWLSGG